MRKKKEKIYDLLQVSMNMPCYNSIKDVGGSAAFEKYYKDYMIDPIDGFDLSVKIELPKLTDQKQKDELVQRLSGFKPNVIGGVFDHFFTAVMKGGTQPDPFRFDLRADTSVFFFPGKDRITVIFGLDFKEKVDRAIAKIFMQEFVEAKRSLGAAPPCMWSVNPPNELAHFDIKEPTGNLGFLSFAILKTHLEKDKKEKVIGVLQVFRNYLQYHIKCSKSYFHSRMRARVVSLLGILNRAKAEIEPKFRKNEMKTASGRTFVRQ